MLSNRDGNVVSLGAEGVVVLPNKSLSKMEEEGFLSFARGGRPPSSLNKERPPPSPNKERLPPPLPPATVEVPSKSSSPKSNIRHLAKPLKAYDAQKGRPAKTSLGIIARNLSKVGYSAARLAVDLYFSLPRSFNPKIE